MSSCVSPPPDWRYADLNWMETKREVPLYGRGKTPESFLGGFFSPTPPCSYFTLQSPRLAGPSLPARSGCCRHDSAKPSPRRVAGRVTMRLRGQETGGAGYEQEAAGSEKEASAQPQVS